MNAHATVADVAHALGVTKNAVMNRIRRGTLTAKKVDGAWRIPRSEYERVVNGAPTNRSQAADEGGTHGAPMNGAQPANDLGTNGAPTVHDSSTIEVEVLHVKLEAAEHAHEATHQELETLRATFERTQHQLGDALASVRSLTDEVKGLTVMIHAHRALPSPLGWLRSAVRQLVTFRT